MAEITVLTYGTFDLFHIGHVNLLQRLRALGTRLVVGCSTDEFNLVKNKKAIVPYAHRKAILESLRCVDRVIPEQTWEQKRTDIARENVQIFGMGDDWAGHFDDLKDCCQVVYLPRTTDISTTEIRDVIAAIKEEKVMEIRHAVERLRFLVDSL